MDLLGALGTPILHRRYVTSLAKRTFLRPTHPITMALLLKKSVGALVLKNTVAENAHSNSVCVCAYSLILISVEFIIHIPYAERKPIVYVT